MNRADPRKAICAIASALIVLSAIMWGAVVLSTVVSRQAAINEATNESRNLMIAFREQLALIMRGVEGEMNMLVDQIRDENGALDLYRWGQKSVLVAPGIAQATLIGADGIIRSTTLEAAPVPLDLSDREHFRAQLDDRTRGLFIGRSIFSRLTGELFIPVTRRIDSADGRFLGVLAVLVSPEALTKLHKLVDLGPKGVITLAGTDDVVRARYTRDRPDGSNGVWTSLAGPGRPRLQADGEDTRIHHAILDGVTRIYASGRIGSYPLVVTVGLELDGELEGWYAETTRG
jgi:hypothetical protein